MVIRVKCPSCGRKGKAPDTARGKNARCPACKQMFPVAPADHQPSEPQEDHPSEPQEDQPIDPKVLRELWLYKELGEEIGPITFEILITLSQKGEVGPESL